MQLPIDADKLEMTMTFGAASTETSDNKLTVPSIPR